VKFDVQQFISYRELQAREMVIAHLEKQIKDRSDAINALKQ
jgi:hypothetical protein